MPCGWRAWRLWLRSQRIRVRGVLCCGAYGWRRIGAAAVGPRESRARSPGARGRGARRGGPAVPVPRERDLAPNFLYVHTPRAPPETHPSTCRSEACRVGSENSDLYTCTEWVQLRLIRVVAVLRFR
eukprot:1717750-Prymnesium_polylepis.3